MSFDALPSTTQASILSLLVVDSINSSSEDDDQPVPYKRQWTRPWIKARENQPNFFDECRQLDPLKFQQLVRMTGSQFDSLLNQIEDKIKKMDTPMRKAIPPKDRLQATLYFLGNGGNLSHTETVTRIPVTTLSQLIPEVCRSIYDLKPKYIPSLYDYTKQDWFDIANDFEASTGYPLCVGSLDGKHCVVQQPSKSGSLFHNYKGTFSVVLLGVANSNCQFLSAEIGSPGSTSDGGDFQRSELKKYLSSEENTIPQSYYRLHKNSEERAKMHFIADDAFKLTTELMKPFPHKRASANQDCFNQGLSRARSTIERTFGQLSKRWQVLMSPIKMDINNVNYIIGACTVLHNFVSKENGPSVLVTDWSVTFKGQKSFQNLSQNSAESMNESYLEAQQMRNNIMNYFTRKQETQSRRNVASLSSKQRFKSALATKRQTQNEVEVERQGEHSSLVQTTEKYATPLTSRSTRQLRPGTQPLPDSRVQFFEISNTDLPTKLSKTAKRSKLQ